MMHHAWERRRQHAKSKETNAKGTKEERRDGLVLHCTVTHHACMLLDIASEYICLALIASNASHDFAVLLHWYVCMRGPSCLRIKQPIYASFYFYYFEARHLEPFGMHGLYSNRVEISQDLIHFHIINVRIMKVSNISKEALACTHEGNEIIIIIIDKSLSCIF